MTAMTDVDYSYWFGRIANGIDKLSEKKESASASEINGSVGTTHIFYADQVSSIIDRSVDMFDLLKNLRNLENKARATGESLV